MSKRVTLDEKKDMNMASLIGPSDPDEDDMDSTTISGLTSSKINLNQSTIQSRYTKSGNASFL